MYVYTNAYVYPFSGYAITAGSYFNEKNPYYASSAPRSADLTGLVVVFKFPVNHFAELTVHGQQYGEYFGAALTSCDVNGDRRHELIVSAPLWSRDVDEGRVYIFSARYNVCSPFPTSPILNSQILCNALKD